MSATTLISGDNYRRNEQKAIFRAVAQTLCEGAHIDW